MQLVQVYNFTAANNRTITSTNQYVTSIYANRVTYNVNSITQYSQLIFESFIPVLVKECKYVQTPNTNGDTSLGVSLGVALGVSGGVGIVIFGGFIIFGCIVTKGCRGGAGASMGQTGSSSIGSNGVAPTFEPDYQPSYNYSAPNHSSSNDAGVSYSHSGSGGTSTAD